MSPYRPGGSPSPALAKGIRALRACTEALGRGLLASPGSEPLRTALREGRLGPEPLHRALLGLSWSLVEQHLVELSSSRPDVTPAPSVAPRTQARQRRSRLLQRELAKQTGSELGTTRLPAAVSEVAWKALTRDTQSAEGLESLPAAPTAASASLWSSVRPEDLGRMHEALLGLELELAPGAGSCTLAKPVGTSSRAVRGSASYYTPDALVEAVLDRALDPMLRSTLTAGGAGACLELRILDPACGGGHFLLAAGRRMATALALQRAPASSSPEALAEESRRALRELVPRCLHGIDLDPLALRITALALSLELGDPSLAAELRRDVLVEANTLLLRPFGRDPDARRSAGVSDSPSVVPRRAPRRPRDSAEAQGFEASLAAAEGRLAPALLAVRQRGGYDLILGNPPWIAHAGRAAQAIPAVLKQHYQCTFASFAGYPTTHGLFVEWSSQSLRQEGSLALVLPTSVADLQGYEAARRAHDQFCEPNGDLLDFGEGQFAGVTQPSMALVSTRRRSGRPCQPAGTPWPLERHDLCPVGLSLLERLADLEPLPRELFGERGLQSQPWMATSLRASPPPPKSRGWVRLREGKDIHPWQARTPRVYADPKALGHHLRDAASFGQVRVLIRQTARYPMACLSDGKGFRNSVLAGFESEAWSAPALLSILNSSLIRWLHYHRFRDARQPILPQVKVAHLRSIPCPPALRDEDRDELKQLGTGLSARKGAVTASEQDELDTCIERLYRLTPDEVACVRQWHHRMGPRPAR